MKVLAAGLTGVMPRSFAAFISVPASKPWYSQTTPPTTNITNTKTRRIINRRRTKE
jgi:hypothetical protein